MKKLNALLLLLSLSFLCGCSSGPGENTDAIDMEEWCDRDRSMPWTGCWTEVAQIDCESGQAFEPELIIEEFRLNSEGIFSVTWSPFEHFVDYAGPYEISEKDGTIELTMGDRAPPDADGRGNFAITDQGALILEDIWLGAREQENVTKSCGHIFRATADASAAGTVPAKTTAEVKSAANTPIAEPTPQPDENVLITTDEYEGVIFIDGDWVPSVEEVRALEKQLDTYLPQQQDAFDSLELPIEERLPTYKRQYWGIIKDGKQVIFANFFCEPFPSYWTHQEVIGIDGGDCYFQIHYDVETGTFFDLYINGSA